MFRPVLRAGLRQGSVAAARRFSTVRPVRSGPKMKLAAVAGFATFACALVVGQKSEISNDADQEKVASDMHMAEINADAEKTGFELVQAAKDVADAVSETVSEKISEKVGSGKDGKSVTETVTEKVTEKVSGAVSGAVSETVAGAVGAVEAMTGSSEKDSEKPSPSKEASEASSEKGSEDPEEGSQAAAFNPETGEINWDCPCLGGMAHGPCGEEFKAAFACFVYSETEPKGIDCITKFETMRTCFRQHPEHYKEELYEDEEADGQAKGQDKGHGQAVAESAKEVASEAVEKISEKAADGAQAAKDAVKSAKSA